MLTAIKCVNHLCLNADYPKLSDTLNDAIQNAPENNHLMALFVLACGVDATKFRRMGPLTKGQVTALTQAGGSWHDGVARDVPHPERPGRPSGRRLRRATDDGPRVRLLWRLGPQPHRKADKGDCEKASSQRVHPRWR